MATRTSRLRSGPAWLLAVLVLAAPWRAVWGQQAADIESILDGLRDLPFHEFVDASYEQVLLRSPQLVTSLGLSRELGIRDGHLDNLCDEFVDETYRLKEGIRDILATYDRSALDDEQQISFDSYSRVLADWAAEHEFMYHFYPVTPGFTAQNELFRFLEDDHPLATVDNAEDYVSRLGEVGDQLGCLIQNLDASEARGIIAPAQMLRQAATQIQGVVPGTARSLSFYTTLAAKTRTIAGLGEADRLELLARAESAINASVIPAYQALVARLIEQITYAPPMNGLWQLPDGDRFYASRVRHHTTTELTPAEIHQIGLDEVARIQGEVRRVFQSLGYPADISFSEGFNRAGVDSGVVPASQILTLNESFIRQAEEDLKEAFDIAPETEVILIGVPQGGFYVPGSIDGSRPGAYYIGVGSDSTRYWMRTIVYHETVPGHHFQISIGNELDVPLFTKTLGFYTAFIEGWALYAEHLVADLGWYDDDVYSEVGRLQWELLRAARLVVDTGLHYHRWSRQQAIDYFVDEVGYSRQGSTQQIDMYLYYNGYFTAYKIGELKILELREHARQELGDLFDLKEFHRAVLLHNCLPLSLLERLVDDYIEAKLPPPPRRVARPRVSP